MQQVPCGLPTACHRYLRMRTQLAHYLAATLALLLLASRSSPLRKRMTGWCSRWRARHRRRCRQACLQILTRIGRHQTTPAGCLPSHALACCRQGAVVVRQALRLTRPAHRTSQLRQVLQARRLTRSAAAGALSCRSTPARSVGLPCRFPPHCLHIWWACTLQRHAAATALSWCQLAAAATSSTRLALAAAPRARSSCKCRWKGPPAACSSSQQHVLLHAMLTAPVHQSRTVGLQQRRQQQPQQRGMSAQQSPCR